MLERLIATNQKYEALEQELMKKEVLENVNKTKEISKEMAELEEIVMAYRNYQKVLDEIKDTKEMLQDKELKEMAKEELIR